MSLIFYAIDCIFCVQQTSCDLDQLNQLNFEELRISDHRLEGLPELAIFGQMIKPLKLSPQFQSKDLLILHSYFMSFLNQGFTMHAQRLELDGKYFIQD